MSPEEKQRRILGILNSYATIIIALPVEQREAKILAVERDFFEDARTAGGSDDSAKEWATGMTGFLRNLLTIIETTGGAIDQTTQRPN